MIALVWKAIFFNTIWNRASWNSVESKNDSIIDGHICLFRICLPWLISRDSYSHELWKWKSNDQFFIPANSYAKTVFTRCTRRLGMAAAQRSKQLFKLTQKYGMVIFRHFVIVNPPGKDTSVVRTPLLCGQIFWSRHVLWKKYILQSQERTLHFTDEKFGDF